MKISLPAEVLYILYHIQKNNFEAYIVGGAVRDILINSLQKLGADKTKEISVTDYDFTTNATPEQIQAIFPDNFYENKFGTVSITYDHLADEIIANGFSLSDENMKNDYINKNHTDNSNKIIALAQKTKIHASLKNNDEISQSSENIKPPDFEITTYRSDGVYKDFRRPKSVEWGENLKDDLSRRDFTINALAISFDNKILESIFTKPTDQTNKKLESKYNFEHAEYNLIDYHNGIKDLTDQLIKTVGDPHRRYSEDSLRMLRAIRFAVQLKMNIHPATKQAIKDKAQLIKHISGERIRDELFKMLKTSTPHVAIQLLDETGLLEFIIPELIKGKGVQQSGHHISDVWTHGVSALEHCPSNDPLVKLATLIHDIGKPATAHFIDNKVTFHNHEIIGSRIASKIAKRLKLSKKESQRLFTLVRYHMFYYQPEHSDASIRRFMRKVGIENIDDILDLREGDRLGSGARKTSWRLEEMKQRMVEQLNQPMDVGDLAINGSDLMQELEIEPGPILGKILNDLLEMVLDDSEINTREKLFEIARKLI